MATCEAGLRVAPTNKNCVYDTSICSLNMIRGRPWDTHKFLEDESGAGASAETVARLVEDAGLELLPFPLADIPLRSKIENDYGIEDSLKIVESRPVPTGSLVTVFEAFIQILGAGKIVNSAGDAIIPKHASGATEASWNDPVEGVEGATSLKLVVQQYITVRTGNTESGAVEHYWVTDEGDQKEIPYVKVDVGDDNFEMQSAVKVSDSEESVNDKDHLTWWGPPGFLETRAYLCMTNNYVVPKGSKIESGYAMFMVSDKVRDMLAKLPSPQTMGITLPRALPSFPIGSTINLTRPSSNVLNVNVATGVTLPANHVVTIVARSAASLTTHARFDLGSWSQYTGSTPSLWNPTFNMGLAEGWDDNPIDVFLIFKSEETSSTQFATAAVVELATDLTVPP